MLKMLLIKVLNKSNAWYHSVPSHPPKQTLLPLKSKISVSRPHHHRKNIVPNSNGDHAHFPFVIVFCPASIPGKFCVPNVCALNFFTMKLNNLNPLA